MVNKQNQKVKRGEIYFYDFGNNEGSIQSGERPVLIIQCDEGNNASPTTVVAAITSAVKKRYLPSHIVLGEDFGLKKPSMVMLEQLRTVNQSELKDYIGFVDSPYLMRLINNGLKKVLGMWIYKPKRTADIRCLCSKCLNDYKSNPDYIIRRLDPFAKNKERCDKCFDYGYEYIVQERKSVPSEGGADNV